MVDAVDVVGVGKTDAAERGKGDVEVDVVWALCDAFGDAAVTEDDGSTRWRH